MPRLTIDKIGAKVVRAERHLDDFARGLQTFHDSKPYAVAQKEEAGQRIYYISRIDPVPDELATVAADTIQNFRSALDISAYQLVLNERGGTEPDWSVYYPITRRAADYPSTRDGNIKGVRQEIIDAIDATEPYEGGKGHALWQLNELSKTDKHRMLVAAGTFYGWFSVGGSFPDFVKDTLGIDIEMPEIRVRPKDTFLPLKVGDKILGTPLDAEEDKNQSFGFGVSFYAPGVIEAEPAIKTLQKIKDRVRSTVDSFEPFFT